MLKYLYYKEVFREIPGEISLGISISGCILHCKGCHSRELWEDRGVNLDVKELKRILKEHPGISCVLFLGGEHKIEALMELFEYVKTNTKYKVAWYCGLDMLPKGKISICRNLDYVKVGHYDQELGGLDSPTTNQRLYQLNHNEDGTYWENDITFKLQQNQ